MVYDILCEDRLVSIPIIKERLKLLFLLISMYLRNLGETGLYDTFWKN